MKFDDLYRKYSNILFQADGDTQQEDLDEASEELDDTEANLDEGDNDLDEGDDDLEEDQDEQNQSQDKSEQQTETKLDDSTNEIDLKFSADLASEFGNTVNEFTHVAAQVIKQRSVKKEQSDKIYDLMGKIKDLLNAANKSI